MQRIVIDEPYEFVPPHRGKAWSSILRMILGWHLRRDYGLVSHEVNGAEHLRESLAAGHGVVLAPNHCRLSDPMAIGYVAKAAKCHVYAMASWHTFKGAWFTGFMARKLGGFSVYREGPDRQALDFAIENLVNAERPLVIYPEGHITRHNSIVAPLQSGVDFIARMAARRREKLDPPGQVVVHPVTYHYEFLGDVEAAIKPALAMLEKRLSWGPQQTSSTRERIFKLGLAFLALKEIEYFGEAQTGNAYDRQEKLVDRMLHPLEDEWLADGAGSLDGEDAHVRVKALRAAILPDMAAGKVTDEERARRWLQLRDVYYAQCIALYPRKYLDPGCPPEHLLETVERYVEDLTGELKPFGPLHLRIDVAEAIPVTSKRTRGEAAEDSLMGQLATKLQQMLDTAARELAERRARDAKLGK